MIFRTLLHSRLAPLLLLFAGFIFVANATAAPAPDVFALEAPHLARTSATVLLTWNRPPMADVQRYEIICNGEVVARTPKLSHTVEGLRAGDGRSFQVRAISAGDVLAGESRRLEVAARAQGEVFDVKEFGAVGNGVADDTHAVRQAIAACTPGGTVTLPAGKYLVGALVLKSDMTLDVPTGTTLQFLGQHKAEYPHVPLQLPGPDGDVPVTSRALLSAVRAENIAIVGGGIINGNGPSWWPPDRSLQRPFVLELVQCRNVLVQGVTIEDPPFWNTHPLYVDDAVFNGVTFRKISPKHGTNGDGLNPDSSRHILIVGCTFQNQDDSIAIKSGKASPAQPRRQRSSEHIVIRDCLFEGRDGAREMPLGFAIGSEVSGGVRDVLVKNCEFRNVAALANIKTNRDRLFARVEDVRVEDCRYVNTRFEEKPWAHAPISIDLFYYSRQTDLDGTVPLTDATPRLRNIHFKNITIENPVGRFVYLCGMRERPFENITFENVTGAAKTGFSARNVSGLSLQGVDVAVKEGEVIEKINVTPDHAAGS
jgi:polygalacturonase